MGQNKPQAQPQAQPQVLRSGDPIAHLAVAKIAREAAAELYETLMGDNQLRAEWLRQHPGKTEKQLLMLFVRKHWGKCIPFARATMARMLDSPLPPHLKDEILDALIKDRSLRPLEASKAPAAVILNREALR